MRTTGTAPGTSSTPGASSSNYLPVAHCTSHVARGWIAFSHVRQLLALARAARARRGSLAVPARRFRPETVGPAVSLCRDHLRTDYPAAAQWRAGFRLDHDGSGAGPVHGDGCALRLFEHHRVAHRRSLPVRARSRADSPRRANRIQDRQPRRRKPASTRLRHRVGRSGDCADDAVEHGAGGRHPLSDHAQRCARVRVRTRSRLPVGWAPS